MAPTPTNPKCPQCGEPGHPVAGLATAKWETYREAVQVRVSETEERTVHRRGMRLGGTMPFMCERGHRWTAERPAHLMAKKRQRAKLRRGF